MSEMSPERQELLKRVVDAQEKMLKGCALIFSGLRSSSDPQVVAASEEALGHLQNMRDLIDAMIDALTATKH
jgi:hypothetical protein